MVSIWKQKMESALERKGILFIQQESFIIFRERSKLSFSTLNYHFCGKITKVLTMMSSRILMNSPYKLFSRK